MKREKKEYKREKRGSGLDSISATGKIVVTILVPLDKWWLLGLCVTTEYM
jgi:hypothetical protein